MTGKDSRTRTDTSSAPNGVVAQHELEALDAADDKRSANREVDVCIGISSFTMLQDGSYLEGVVKNVSDGGARVSGEVEGLSVGQNVDLGLVIQGQKIRYSCVVMHIEPEVKSYGLRFVGGPEPAAEENRRARLCIMCQKEYAPELHYCGICGGELSRPRAV